MSMSWNLSQISRDVISRGANPSLMRVWAIWSVKSGSVGNTRLLSRAKMLLVSLRTADVSPGSSPLRDVSRNVPQGQWARRNACRRSQACCLFQWIHVSFLLRVDYALEGSTFWLSKLCHFCRLFHASLFIDPLFSLQSPSSAVDKI